MLRRFCRRTGPRHNTARTFRRPKVTLADRSGIPRISALGNGVYSWGLDKYVTMPLGLRPDAAGHLSFLARPWADSRPGFTSICARVAAVWVARGRIPSLEEGAGSLPPAVGGGRSCPKETGVPSRRERAGGGPEDRRLLPGELDGARVPTNATANLRPASFAVRPGRPAGAEFAEPQHCGNQEANRLRDTDGSEAGTRTGGARLGHCQRAGAGARCHRAPGAH